MVLKVLLLGKDFLSAPSVLISYLVFFYDISAFDNAPLIDILCGKDKVNVNVILAFISQSML